MTMTLEQVAAAMVAPGKGILAADESTGTIKRRFDSIKVDNTEDNRRDYREMLFRSTDAMKTAISGVILFDETLRQKAKDGTPLAKIIADSGALPGIKVDGSTKPLQFCKGEVITEGLDGLPGRVKEYVGLGAKFAKWRAVIDIGQGMPSYTCIKANAHLLARYAAICLEGGLVPIVEPEVLMDGAHDIDRCAEVTEWVLKEVYQELYYNRVVLEQTILKPNMVISGKKAQMRADAKQVAEATVRTLKRFVPSAVPGIAFLSGGQSASEATAHLNLMNQQSSLPWALSFSYGRALQEEALRAWGGKADNVNNAQQAFIRRAKFVGQATTGHYDPSQEQKAA